jgi:hypothetical protein
MNQTEEQSRSTSPDRRPDVVTEALDMAKKAEELRHVAVKRLLEDRERIDRDLKTLGYEAPAIATNGAGALPQAGRAVKHGEKTGVRFKGMRLANVGRILLQENGVLHGKEIEVLAKEGGFKSRSEHFQSLLSVAFKRNGGFTNVGGNRWKIADSA